MKNKILLLAATLLLCACGTAQNIATLPPECLASELDGSLTILVTGSGRNKGDAQEQARKNAVSIVLFDGIRKNNAQPYQAKPLLLEVNARERHQDYFDIFFADGGEYKKYVSNEDTRPLSTEKSKDRHEVHVRLAVRVLVPQLRQRMKNDGIIKMQ